MRTPQGIRSSRVVVSAPAVCITRSGAIALTAARTAISSGSAARLVLDVVRPMPPLPALMRACGIGVPGSCAATGSVPVLPVLAPTGGASVCPGALVASPWPSIAITAVASICRTSSELPPSLATPPPPTVTPALPTAPSPGAPTARLGPADSGISHPRGAVTGVPDEPRQPLGLRSTDRAGVFTEEGS